MRTVDPWSGRRAVPIEVAEAWHREAVAARSAGEAALRRAASAESAVERLEAELAALRSELAASEAARAEAGRRRDEAPPTDERAARLAADLANVRRRTDETIARARAAERAAGVRALAEVRDDLARSLDSNPDRESAWFHGHRAILGKVRQLLREAGASEVGEPGEPFDPAVHEAVDTAPGPAGRVVDVHQVGIRLDDGTLVRPARVTVGVAEEAHR